MTRVAGETLSTARRDAEQLRSQAEDELGSARRTIKASLQQLSLMQDLSRSYLERLEQASALLSTSELLAEPAHSDVEEEPGARPQSTSVSPVSPAIRPGSPLHANRAPDAPQRTNGTSSASAVSDPAGSTVITDFNQ